MRAIGSSLSGNRRNGAAPAYPSVPRAPDPNLSELRVGRLRRTGTSPVSDPQRAKRGLAREEPQEDELSLRLSERGVSARRIGAATEARHWDSACGRFTEYAPTLRNSVRAPRAGFANQLRA